MIKNNVYFIIVCKMYIKYFYVRIVDNKIMYVFMHTFFFLSGELIVKHLLAQHWLSVFISFSRVYENSSQFQRDLLA